MKKYLVLIMGLILLTMLLITFKFYSERQLEIVLLNIESVTSRINGQIIQSGPSYDGPLKSYDEDQSEIKKVVHKDFKNLIVIYTDGTSDIYIEVNDWLSRHGKSYDIRYFDAEKGVKIYE